MHKTTNLTICTFSQIVVSNAGRILFGLGSFSGIPQKYELSRIFFDLFLSRIFWHLPVSFGNKISYAQAKLMAILCT